MIMTIQFYANYHSMELETLPYFLIFNFFFNTVHHIQGFIAAATGL
jgi:hypothetical protein